MASNSNTKFTFIVLAIAMAAGVGTQLLTRDSAKTPSSASSATEVLDTQPLAPFKLTFGDGTTFANDNFADKWTLLFFGFTNCPDVCPTTLATLAGVSKQLAARDVAMPQVIFVSVDPRADTAASADRYAKGFNKLFRAAAGSTEALRKLTDPLGILFLEVEVAGGYTVDHTTAMTMIGPNGALAAVLSGPHKIQELSDDIQRLIQ